MDPNIFLSLNLPDLPDLPPNHLLNLQIPSSPQVPTPPITSPIPEFSTFLQLAQMTDFKIFGSGEPIAPAATILGVPIDQVQLFLANNPIITELVHQLDESMALPSPSLTQVTPIPSLVAPNNGFHFFMMKRAEAKKAGEPIDPRRHHIVWKSLSEAERLEYDEQAKEYQELLEKSESEGMITIGPSPLAIHRRRLREERKKILEEQKSLPSEDRIPNLEQVWLRDIQNQMADSSVGVPQISFVTNAFNFFRRAWPMARRQKVRMEGFSLNPYIAWHKTSENERASVEKQYQNVKGMLEKMEKEGRITLDWNFTAVLKKRKEKKMKEME